MAKRSAIKPKRKAKAAKTETVLVLRTCKADMTAYGGFKWPASGPVESPAKLWANPTMRPDELKLGFTAKAECGGGLHGALWGEGDGTLFNWYADAKWLVVEVVAADVIDLEGKVKFPRGVVVHCGDRLSATEYVRQHGGAGRGIIGGTATAGYRGTATAGDSGTATAGYRGTATAGYRGTATAGYSGTATAGYSGTATAGDSGTATAGDSGTATAGDSGTATAGDRGTVCIRYWDVKADRYRLAIGYVGEDGIKPNTKYRVVDAKLIEAN